MRIGTVTRTAGRADGSGAPGTGAVVPAALLLVTSLLAVGCVSGGGSEGEVAGPTTTLAPVADPMALAESMIAGDLAEQIGLGPLRATCADPGPLAVGVRFSCAADTLEGASIAIDGSVNAEGRLELITTNLVTAGALTGFEEAAAVALNEEVGSTFTADAVDCGQQAVVLPPEQVLSCALTVASSGEVYDLTLTVTDLDQRHFALVVADEPRSG